MKTIDAFEAAHFCSGRALIRGLRDPDLVDNPELWAQIWERFRAELLPDWIARHPGDRPAAWWEFDCVEEIGEGETVPEFLYRLGLIEPDELDAIRKKAQDLAAFNRGRKGAGPNSHYIPPDDIHIFAIDMGLLTPEEVEVLTV
jgi:hypothetical protein